MPRKKQTRISVERIDTFSQVAICSKCTQPMLSTEHRELAHKNGIVSEPSMQGKQRINSEAWQTLAKKYGVPCVGLGPDEGHAFYSRYYCAACLREMADLLDKEGEDG